MASTRYEVFPPLEFVPFETYNKVTSAAFFFLLFCCPFFFVFRRPTHPARAPKLLPMLNNYPVLGAVRFFTARYEWYRDAVRSSLSGSFSFWIGPYFVVGLSGSTSRQTFLQNQNLGIWEGYAVLFGGGPRLKDETGGDVATGPGFLKYFTARVIHLLRREQINKRLSYFIRDIQARLDELPSRGLTDPFESIYGIVFQLTMRMVGCTEIAEDPAELRRTLQLFEIIEKSSTATSIIFPWMPTFGVMKRTLAGARLYFKVKKIMNNRKKTGIRYDDALQYLMDTGDDIKFIIQFIAGAVFAGQFNTGINASFMLAYLGANPYWYGRVRDEIDIALIKYAPDTSISLTQRFESVPLEAWETEFPLLECCLKDSIRLQLLGTMYRRNIGGKDIQIGNEVIPPGAFVTYHFSDIHQDPNVYPDPLKWDPSRYFPERAEDKKQPLSWLGWGAGRHPCLGKRFAQLEQTVIAAVFLTRFEYNTCDEWGNPLDAVPDPDINAHAATKPVTPIRLNYKPRKIAA